MYFIDFVTLFFANNFNGMSDHYGNFIQFFLDPEVVIFSSYTMFINAFTKEFTLVNNTIPSYDSAFEHLLYY